MSIWKEAKNKFDANAKIKRFVYDNQQSVKATISDQQIFNYDAMHVFDPDHVSRVWTPCVNLVIFYI